MSKQIEDLRNWAALVLAWASVFPALILFLDVWFAGRTQFKGFYGPFANLLGMFLAIMVFFTVNRISKILYKIRDVRSLKKAFLMAVTMIITGISLPSTSSTYAQPKDSFLMALSFMIMSYSAFSILWRGFNVAIESLRSEIL